MVKCGGNWSQNVVKMQSLSVCTKCERPAFCVFPGDKKCFFLDTRKLGNSQFSPTPRAHAQKHTFRDFSRPHFTKCHPVSPNFPAKCRNPRFFTFSQNSRDTPGVKCCENVIPVREFVCTRGHIRGGKKSKFANFWSHTPRCAQLAHPNLHSGIAFSTIFSRV